jgi:hypothetical protein
VDVVERGGVSGEGAAWFGLRRVTLGIHSIVLKRFLRVYDSDSQLRQEIIPLMGSPLSLILPKDNNLSASSSIASQGRISPILVSFDKDADCLSLSSPMNSTSRFALPCVVMARSKYTTTQILLCTTPVDYGVQLCQTPHICKGLFYPARKPVRIGGLSHRARKQIRHNKLNVRDAGQTAVV